jgi:hypothetical protein
LIADPFYALFRNKGKNDMIRLVTINKASILLWFSILSSIGMANTTDRRENLDLSYPITANTLSQGCEFYVASFGDAYSRNTSERWLEAEVMVDRAFFGSEYPKAVNIGVFVEFIIDAKGTTRSEILTANYIREYSLLRIPYSDYDSNSSNYRKISGFNFFIDIKVAANTYYRYWIAAKPYTFQSIFWGYPYTYVDRGNGSGITYAQYPSPILEKKRTCAEQD